MKQTNFLNILFLALFLISAQSVFSQDLKSLSITELETLKKEAISKEQYDLAGKINDEIKSRKSLADIKQEAKINLDKAVKEENFEEAAKQKEILKTVEEIEDAVKSEDYAKATELKIKVERIKTGEPENVSGLSGNSGKQEVKSTEVTSKKERRKADPANAALVTTKGYVPPSEGKAVVYLTRVSALGFAVAFQYFHEDQYIGRSKGVSLIRCEVEPGEHLFWVSSENVDFITIDAEAGKTYMVYVDVVPGAWKAQVKFSPVLPVQSDRIQRGAEVIARHPPSTESPEEINKIMGKLAKRGWIEDKLNAYETKWKDAKGYFHINANQNISEEKLRISE